MAENMVEKDADEAIAGPSAEAAASLGDGGGAKREDTSFWLSPQYFLTPTFFYNANLSVANSLFSPLRH